MSQQAFVSKGEMTANSPKIREDMEPKLVKKPTKKKATKKNIRKGYQE